MIDVDTCDERFEQTRYAASTTERVGVSSTLMREVTSTRTDESERLRAEQIELRSSEDASFWPRSTSER